MEYSDGVLLTADNPSASLHKISEIYDCIAFSGAGKYSEFENLRKAGIRHADLKGFMYSREDVTARSLANTYSQAVGTIFSQELKPLEVEILVVGVGVGDEPNEIYRISFDGSIIDERGYAVIGGRADVLQTYLKDRVPAPLPSLANALSLSFAALLEGGNTPKISPDGLEVAVLDRTKAGRKFRRLSVAEVRQYVST
jgi:proteasome alpha subunit